MVKVGGNIGKFRKHVKILILQLKAKGQGLQQGDLMVMLIKGYGTNHNGDLSMYYLLKKDLYKDQHYQCQH